MKKSIIFLLFLSAIAACKNKDHAPDVSGIKINLELQRFDQDFFSIDSNNVLPGLNKMHERYPGPTSIFLQNILGLDSSNTLKGVKQFLNLNHPIYEEANRVFPNMNAVEKDLKKAFQFTRHYFPDYKLPEKVITVVGPLDAMAQTANGYTPDFLGPDFLGISLQFYLGKDFPAYHDMFFIEKVAPEYRSRRFSKEYIVPDIMQLIADDLFPDKSNGRALIEQMIERGKQWWLLDKLMPTTEDSLKTGYTGQQLTWCRENEGLIWSYIIKNEDLNTINPATIQTYIGEGPFTQGFSQELSPGNMGQWIGWQIVKKFAAKHPSMKPSELMMTEAKTILEEAKYKPK